MHDDEKNCLLGADNSCKKVRLMGSQQWYPKIFLRNWSCLQDHFVRVAKAAIWDHSDLEAWPDDRISLHLSSLARGQGGWKGISLRTEFGRSTSIWKCNVQCGRERFCSHCTEFWLIFHQGCVIWAIALRTDLTGLGREKFLQKCLSSVGGWRRRTERLERLKTMNKAFAVTVWWSNLHELILSQLSLFNLTSYYSLYDRPKNNGFLSYVLTNCF